MPENAIAKLITEELLDGLWRIKFTDQHAIIIDIDLNQLFIDGELLKLDELEKSYTKHLLKEKNRFKQKKRIRTLYAKSAVLAVDIGYDGRIFLKLWLSKVTYDRFRRKPEWCASYWNDKDRKEKKIYVQNLQRPKHLFKIFEDEKVVT